MIVTFLGTGTSTGVPQIGCTCDVCLSEDQRDKRFRSSILIETDDNKRILVDCTPDFRTQILNFIKPLATAESDFPIYPIDCMLLTHGHSDHMGGIDDLRPSALFGQVPIYTESVVADDIRQRLAYCFSENKYPGIPELKLCPINENEVVAVGDTSIEPLRVYHGDLPILGFKIGEKFAYITDMKSIPEPTLQKLYGVEVLVLNALRMRPHPTHQTIEDAILLSEKIGAKRTYLTHLSHEAGMHENSTSFLPVGVEFAYDGLQIKL